MRYDCGLGMIPVLGDELLDADEKADLCSAIHQEGEVKWTDGYRLKRLKEFLNLRIF